MTLRVDLKQGSDHGNSVNCWMTGKRSLSCSAKGALPGRSTSNAYTPASFAASASVYLHVSVLLTSITQVMAVRGRNNKGNDLQMQLGSSVCLCKLTVVRNDKIGCFDTTAPKQSTGEGRC
jgi:hypothetical protein